MPGDALIVRENHRPFSIRRNVREPIIQFVRRDLLLLAAVWAHAPDLRQAGTLGVEVNVFSVGRIFRAVVEAFRGRQPRLVAARDRNTVDVELTAALANEREPGAVGRPTVPIRRKILGDAPGRAATNWHDVNNG